MHVVSTISEVRKTHRELGGTWGLVPTMGALHAGHISLVERARAENQFVAASIFVNPTQFGPHEDLGKYPRPLERDLEMLRAQNVTLVFTPTPEEMYPRGFQTYVTVEQVSQVLEGAARPGHLRGVATVVCKLFNIFQPDRAYFGQKDAQQVAVIRRMTRDLDLPVGIVVCPTVREPDGLALSSRNVYLNSTERQAATALYRALVSAQEAWTRGEREGGRLRAVMMKVLEAEPLARVDYVSAADPETLIEFESATDRVLLSLAVRIGTTRLIDNFLLEE